MAANWRVDHPAPQTPLHSCESCGREPGLTIFVPNGLGGGRRLCRVCLALYDSLRPLAGRG